MPGWPEFRDSDRVVKVEVWGLRNGDIEIDARSVAAIRMFAKRTGKSIMVGVSNGDPPAPLRWTSEPPTEPGWYWWRWKSFDGWMKEFGCILKVCEDTDGVLTWCPPEGMWVAVGKECFGEFAGPIPQPE